MKYVAPALGTLAALGLFAFSAKDTSTAIAVERPSHDETFKQLDPQRAQVSNLVTT